MKIKNATSNSIEFSDLKLPGYGLGKSIIRAGQEISVYDEDAEKSAELNALLSSGAIQKIGSDEPSDGSQVSEPLKEWVLLNDLYVQFSGGNEGKNGISTANTYDGTHGTPVTVGIEITNGLSVTDILNGVSTVVASISGGSAAGKTINGGAGPVTLTFVEGAASVLIDATGAGTVNLHLASATHPSVTLLPDLDAVITLA